MSTDQVWIKSLITQSRSCSGDPLRPNHLGFSFSCQGVNTCTIALTKGITKISNIIWNIVQRTDFINPQPNHLMPTKSRQTAKDMDVLPWKILMNEKDPH